MRSSQHTRLVNAGGRFQLLTTAGSAGIEKAASNRRHSKAAWPQCPPGSAHLRQGYGGQAGALTGESLPGVGTSKSPFLAAQRPLPLRPGRPRPCVLAAAVLHVLYVLYIVMFCFPASARMGHQLVGAEARKTEERVYGKGYGLPAASRKDSRDTELVYVRGAFRQPERKMQSVSRYRAPS